MEILPNELFTLDNQSKNEDIINEYFNEHDIIVT